MLKKETSPQPSAANRVTISPACSVAPSTSPVCPPICTRLSQARTVTVAASKMTAARPANGPRQTARIRAPSTPAVDDALARRHSGAERQSVAPCRRQHRHQHRHRGPAGAVGGDQRPRDRGRIGEACERAHPEQQRQHQRTDPVCADPAVAHDLELAFPRLAAAKTVGGVGQPVFVQTAGHSDRRRDAERGRRPRRQSQPVAERVDRSADEADENTGDRKCPCGARDRAAVNRRGRPERQSGQENRADLQFLRAGGEPGAVRCHLALALLDQRLYPESSADDAFYLFFRASRGLSRPAERGNGRQRRGGAARTRAHQTAAEPRPPRGSGRLAGALARPCAAASGADGNFGVRRQSRRHPARRFGLSGRSDGPDGGEFFRRRGCDQPTGAHGRRGAPRHSAVARRADGGFHRAAGAWRTRVPRCRDRRLSRRCRRSAI